MDDSTQDLPSPPSQSDTRGEQIDHGEESYRGTGRLRDRVAVVTGGDSGIGRAVAIAFAREGADVVLAYLEADQEDAEETGRLVEQAGQEVMLIPTDLREEEACQQVIDRTVATFGRINTLVNNAAFQMAQANGIDDITTEQFDNVMKTNLYAMFWMCKKALPHMPKGSTIINTSSIQASDPAPQLLDYATSKAGIVNFTRGLAMTVADRGIRVNSVAPGPVRTPLNATMTDDMMETFGEDTPLGRAGQPAEIAPAFVFLASPESSFVTGEVLAVTGGQPV